MTQQQVNGHPDASDVPKGTPAQASPPDLRRRRSRPHHVAQPRASTWKSQRGASAGERADEDSNRATASTMAPVWLGLDAARNRAFLKGW